MRTWSVPHPPASRAALASRDREGAVSPASRDRSMQPHCHAMRRATRNRRGAVLPRSAPGRQLATRFTEAIPQIPGHTLTRVHPKPTAATVRELRWGFTDLNTLPTQGVTVHHERGAL